MTPMSDQEQIELVKQWWNDYGKAIAIAIAIGLLIGFGWRYWNNYQSKRNIQASIIYQNMVGSDALKDYTSTQNYAKILMNNFSRSPYASFSALLIAKEYVGQNQFDSAIQQLNWVINNSRMASMRQIARLRAARILVMQNKLDDAMKLILTVDDAAFTPLIAAIKGDIFLAKGDRNSAQQSYQTAQAGLVALGSQDPFLTMKLAQ